MNIIFLILINLEIVQKIHINAKKVLNTTKIYENLHPQILYKKIKTNYFISFYL